MSSFPLVFITVSGCELHILCSLITALSSTLGDNDLLFASVTHHENFLQDNLTITDYDLVNLIACGVEQKRLFII